MADPFSPVPEVRKHTENARDSYGEIWMMIDGIDTKVPSIKAANALLAKQDKTRIQIRAALDETGIRDRTVGQLIEIDGEIVEVELLPPGAANVLQFNMDPTCENIDKATAIQARKDLEQRTIDDGYMKPTQWQRIKRSIKRFFRRKGQR